MQEVQKIWVQSLCWKESLKWEMATHSSILVLKTAWTEEPGRLQPMVSQRVGGIQPPCPGHCWALTLNALPAEVARGPCHSAGARRSLTVPAPVCPAVLGFSVSLGLGPASLRSGGKAKMSPSQVGSSR